MAEAPKKGRLTLYEDMLSAETLAQMKAKDAAVQAEEAKKKSNASLMFKPTNLGKKPTANKNQPAKRKPNFTSMQKSASSSSPSTVISAPPTIFQSTGSPDPQNKQSSSIAVQPPSQQQGNYGPKRGFNDWLADEDEESQYYNRPKLERGGRRKKKKNKHFQEQTWSWDDIYDPTVPVNFLEYPKSDAKYDMNDSWKRRLYAAHRSEMQRQGKATRPGRSDRDNRNSPTRNMNFAPPEVPSFAPPATYSHDEAFRSQSIARSSPLREDDGSLYVPIEISREETGDDAFARRIALSQTAQSQLTAASPQHSEQHPSPSTSSTVAAPPIAQKQLTGDAAEKAAKAAAQIAALRAKIAASKPSKSNSPPTDGRTDTKSPIINMAAAEQSPPPPPPQGPSIDPGVVSPILEASGTISAAPTFNPEYFDRKEQSTVLQGGNLDSATVIAEQEEPRSNRPGQAGFAERMLKKMGWEKGHGLGKAGDGITTAIVAKAEKRKKLPDSAGGGFTTPANMGKIVGGKKKASKLPGEAESAGEGDLGSMSEVVKLEGMLKGMDVDHEIQENNLLQEIGDEMGEFGTVERLFIWREHLGGTNDVFVKFTSQLSALRAVKAMDGEEFADNVIEAKFWSSEKFENGDYA